MDIEKLRIKINNHPNIRRLLVPAILCRRYYLQKRDSSMHKLYQNLCDLLVSDPIIRLDGYQGKFVMDVRSDIFRSILFHRAYESHLSNIALKYLDRNRDVVDVGANVGLYSVFFAKIVNGRTVLAIEPTQAALSRLYKNIEINNVSGNVVVFEGIVSNTSGRSSIKVIEGKSEYSTIGELVHPSAIRYQHKIEEVESSTLDDLIDKESLDPGFIKIDVEGVENLIFEGARTVMENHRPIVISELSDCLLKENGSSSREVIEIINKYDYRVVDPFLPGQAAGKREYGHILCLPKELDLSKTVGEEV